MNLDEIVGEIVERGRSFMIPQFAAKPVRQTGITPHRCPNGPVLSFDETEVETCLRSGLPHTALFSRADALGWRIAGLILGGTR